MFGDPAQSFVDLQVDRGKHTPPSIFQYGPERQDRTISRLCGSSTSLPAAPHLRLEGALDVKVQSEGLPSDCVLPRSDSSQDDAAGLSDGILGHVDRVVPVCRLYDTRIADC
jgi:hypothetical protein